MVGPAGHRFACELNEGCPLCNPCCGQEHTTKIIIFANMPNVDPQLDTDAPDWTTVVPPPPGLIDLTVRQLLKFGVSYLPHRSDLGS